MRRLFLLSLLAIALSACGLKGALYLPQDKPPASGPAAQNAPSTDKNNLQTPTK